MPNDHDDSNESLFFDHRFIFKHLNKKSHFRQIAMNHEPSFVVLCQTCSLTMIYSFSMENVFNFDNNKMCVYGFVCVCGFCRLLDILLDLHIGWTRHFWKLLTRSNSILNGFFWLLFAMAYHMPDIRNTRRKSISNEICRKWLLSIDERWASGSACVNIHFHLRTHCASFSIDTTLIRYYRWISMKFYITSIRY